MGEDIAYLIPNSPGIEYSLDLMATHPPSRMFQ
jgi:hypothetical protein